MSPREIAKGVKVLKDLNFSNDGLGPQPSGVPVVKQKITLGRQVRDALMEQMKVDVRWLIEHNIMDYSLLLGIAHVDARTTRKSSASALKALNDMLVGGDLINRWQRDHGGTFGEVGERQETNPLYYLGIIDILQEYDLKKKMENLYKGTYQGLVGGDTNAISAVESSQYGKRFLSYMGRNIVSYQ